VSNLKYQEIGSERAGDAGDEAKAAEAYDEEECKYVVDVNAYAYM
jgi:hypothetical protein